jgi:hypothetical protein
MEMEGHTIACHVILLTITFASNCYGALLTAF